MATCFAVTGGTGFTGPFVVRAIRERHPDAAIRVLVRPGSDVARIADARPSLVSGDLTDGASLDRLFDGADVLANVASLGFDWVDTLAAALRRSTVRRGVFIGTTAMLTRLPVKSKAVRERGEALVRESGVAWTILRPTMIYGTPGDRNIARLIAFIRRAPVVPVIAPDALQQPVHVRDVAAAVMAVLDSDVTIGRAYNLAGRHALTFEQLVRTTIAATGRRRLVVRLPFGPVRAAVGFYNRLVSTPRIKLEQVDRLREDKNFDWDEAGRDFGYAPRTFEDGVREEVRLCFGTKHA